MRVAAISVIFGCVLVLCSSAAHADACTADSDCAKGETCYREKVASHCGSEDDGGAECTGGEQDVKGVCKAQSPSGAKDEPGGGAPSSSGSGNARSSGDGCSALPGHDRRHAGGELIGLFALAFARTRRSIVRGRRGAAGLYSVPRTGG